MAPRQSSLLFLHPLSASAAALFQLRGALNDGGVECLPRRFERPQSPSYTWTLLTCPGKFSLSLSVFGQRLLPWTPHSRTLSGVPPVGPMTLMSSANFRKGLSASDAYRASADLVGFSLTPYLTAMRLNPAQFSWTTYLYNVLQFNLVKPGSRAKATMERSSECKITAVRII